MSDHETPNHSVHRSTEYASRRTGRYDSDTSTPHYSSDDELADHRLPVRPSTQAIRQDSFPRRRSVGSDRKRDTSLSPDELDHTYYDRAVQSDGSPQRSSTAASPSSSHSDPERNREEKAAIPQLPREVRYGEKLSLAGHEAGVAQVRFSPDGRWIASAGADAAIKVWDASTGRLMHTLEGHLAGVSTIAWSPDSLTIASGSDDKVIRLWDRATGEPYANPFLGHHNYIFSVAFSPKGNMLVSGSYDEAVVLWDVRAGLQMHTLPAHSDPVGGVDFVRDGTMVVSCSTDGLIRLWDTGTGQCLRTLVHEDNAGVVSVQFSPNGKYVLAWTLDGCIRLWDYVEGLCKKTYQGHVNAKYSMGGAFGVYGRDAFVVSGSEDGNLLIWDVKSKHILQKLEGAHEGPILWADTHPTEEAIVTCGIDGLVKVWVNEDEAKIENGFKHGEDEMDVDTHIKESRSPSPLNHD